MRPLLEISGLNVRFSTPEGEVAAVRDVSLQLQAGECLGVVGESGSGKSQVFLAALGLLARNGSVDGTARFDDFALIGGKRADLNRIRGARIGMIFQDPMTSLAPHLTIGEQLSEVLQFHRGLDRRSASDRAREQLERVHIGDAATRLGQYPHELSGGMRQRVMIAMALLCEPQLVIADEPTTALDVTVQAEILALFRELRSTTRLALAVISHDAGVIAELCDRVAVMYAGRVVEEAAVDTIFTTPRHPYTQGLLAAVPRIDGTLDGPMQTVPGQPPAALEDIPGCSFAARCPRVGDRCRVERPELRANGNPMHIYACHHPVVEWRK
ncbi:MAG TPA: ABC transporter ATP-binding protein [Steroidobacteraceae bacterium]|nr:ABC transporter ATP-binding protein [Steroidobacteraceae bacterium]